MSTDSGHDASVARRSSRTHCVVVGALLWLLDRVRMLMSADACRQPLGPWAPLCWGRAFALAAASAFVANPLAPHTG